MQNVILWLRPVPTLSIFTLKETWKLTTHELIIQNDLCWCCLVNVMAGNFQQKTVTSKMKHIITLERWPHSSRLISAGLDTADTRLGNPQDKVQWLHSCSLCTEKTQGTKSKDICRSFTKCLQTPPFGEFLPSYESLSERLWTRCSTVKEAASWNSPIPWTRTHFSTQTLHKSEIFFWLTFCRIMLVLLYLFQVLK